MIGKELRFRRKQAVLTQDELAEKSGISVGTIRKIESGKENFDYSKLKVLFNTLNYEINIITKNYDANTATNRIMEFNKVIV